MQAKLTPNEKGFEAVSNYLLEYTQRKGWYHVQGYYSGLLFHMLMDAKKEPITPRNVKARIAQLVKGKRFLEIGTGNGVFLHFLKSHGAVVGATTKNPNVGTTRGMLGENALLVQTNMENIGKHAEIKKFNPHYVIAYDPFSHQKNKGLFPFAKVYDGLNQVLSPHARIYVQPFSESHPRSAERLAKRLKTIPVHRSSTHLKGTKLHAQNETFRFSPARRKHH